MNVMLNTHGPRYGGTKICQKVAKKTEKCLDYFAKPNNNNRVQK
jgi:hypothetical protein